MADITQSLRDVLTAYGKEEEREEALAEEKRRFDINKSLRERELARADQEFARKQKLWTREDQDQQAMDIANKIALEEPQVKADSITDTYVDSGAKLPELSGPGIMSLEERMKYLDDLASGSIEKREPIILTPEQKRIEEEQSLFGQKLVDSKAFKETELDKLNKAGREILNAGYKIPNELAKEINLAKATYLEKEKSDTDKITKRLNELNKEASELRIKKGKAEDSFSKIRKSDLKDKGTYSQTFKALENMYEKIGRPDTFGVGDELKIENAILTYGDSLSASDNQTTRAIIKSRNDYNGILTNVKEEDFTNKFKENLAKIIKEEGPKGIKTSTSGSKESDEISARLKEIEKEKRTQTNLLKTPDEKRQAILRGFLPDSSSENKKTTEDKKSEKGSNSYKKTNNFTNIEKSNDNWVGKVKNGSSERFESFEKPEYGARAAIKDLRTKVKSGYDTIAKAITRHAPPSDNNPTEAYIANVAKMTGIDPNQKLTEDDLVKVVKAMSIQEHGQGVLDVLTDDVLNKAYDLSIDKDKKESSDSSKSESSENIGSLDELESSFNKIANEDMSIKDDDLFFKSSNIASDFFGGGTKSYSSKSRADFAKKNREKQRSLNKFEKENRNKIDNLIGKISNEKDELEDKLFNAKTIDAKTVKNIDAYIQTQEFRNLSLQDKQNILKERARMVAEAGRTRDLINQKDIELDRAINLANRMLDESTDASNVKIAKENLAEIDRYTNNPTIAEGLGQIGASALKTSVASKVGGSIANNLLGKFGKKFLGMKPVVSKSAKASDKKIEPGKSIVPIGNATTVSEKTFRSNKDIMNRISEIFGNKNPRDLTDLEIKELRSIANKYPKFKKDLEDVMINFNIIL